jgi:hypothetical protein
MSILVVLCLSSNYRSDLLPHYKPVSPGGIHLICPNHLLPLQAEFLDNVLTISNDIAQASSNIYKPRLHNEQLGGVWCTIRG